MNIYLHINIYIYNIHMYSHNAPSIGVSQLKPVGSLAALLTLHVQLSCGLEILHGLNHGRIPWDPGFQY